MVAIDVFQIKKSVSNNKIGGTTYTWYNKLKRQVYVIQYIQDLSL